MLPNESVEDVVPVDQPAATPAAKRAPGWRATSSEFPVPSAWIRVEGRREFNCDFHTVALVTIFMGLSAAALWKHVKCGHVSRPVKQKVTPIQRENAPQVKALRRND
jgi:hypothetical protein